MSIRRTLALGAAMAAALAAPSIALAECWRQAFRFGPSHPESTSLWRTRAGEACAGQLFPGPRTTLHSLAIERQAANGVAGAGVGSKLHYAYNPRPGFVGRDQFVMRVDYEVNGQRGASRVRIDVEVTPR